LDELHTSRRGQLSAFHGSSKKRTQAQKLGAENVSTISISVSCFHVQPQPVPASNLAYQVWTINEHSLSQLMVNSTDALTPHSGMAEMSSKIKAKYSENHLVQASVSTGTQLNKQQLTIAKDHCNKMLNQSVGSTQLILIHSL